MTMKALTLLFLLKEDKVLLAMKKRGFGAGRWNGVGGKLDAGETVEQALVRETQEEIAVTPLVYEKMAEITFNEFHNDQPSQMLVHIYTASSWEGEPTESEEMSPHWFNKNELPFDDMWPDDSFWLPQVLEGKKLRCEFTLDENDTIISSEIAEVTEF